MTGLMIAGMGMLAFVTRAGLGSGPNLSCTALYLTLLYIVRNGHVLGNKFHLLVDGTASDNKNNELIFFLAWLVETDVFDEASFFCMIVGHTFSRIDQSFRTMIVKLLAVPVCGGPFRSYWRTLRNSCLRMTSRRRRSYTVFRTGNYSLNPM